MRALIRLAANALQDLGRCERCEQLERKIAEMQAENDRILGERIAAERLATRRLYGMRRQRAVLAEKRDWVRRYKAKWEAARSQMARDKEAHYAEIARVRELVTEIIARRAKGSPATTIDPLLRAILKGGH